MPREKSEGSGEYIIAEYYHTSSLQSLLKIDYMKGLMTGHCIRRCEHCKRFYLSTNAYRTRFCDKPSLEGPKFTCKQIAYRKTHVINTGNMKHVWDYVRLSDHLAINIHKSGHAVTAEGVEKMVQYFDYHVYGIQPKMNLEELQTSVFALPKNKDSFADTFASKRLY